MRTFLKTTSPLRDRLRGPLTAIPARLRGDGAGGEGGFLLVEVMMSALLVALIVTATFNGFDVAGRLTADQRRHSEAELLASESQEQLRSEPASALDALETNPHKYTKTVGGTIFTITQEAKPVGSSGNKTGCSVSETTAQTGSNFQITSSVTWALLTKAERPPVKVAGVITPPTGSAIEVDVTNGLNTGVANVTARAKFIPVESGSYNTVEGTTGAAGCVVLTGIQATSAEVEIVPRIGFVTVAGALEVPPKKLTIAPNVTTHYIVQYAEAGRIEANFTYNKATTFEGKAVVGDTFVAQQSGKMQTTPEYEVGSTHFEYEAIGEEHFKALTGEYGPNSWTAAGSRYPHGDLFPFKEKWLVYAGDCEANNTGPEARAEAGPVTSGATATVSVPLSYTKLSIYTGSGEGNKGELTKKTYGSSAAPAVTITNTKCETAPKEPNALGTTFIHQQTETLLEGRLKDPFQPFGTLELCFVEPTAKKTYTVPFTNSTVAGSTPTIYLGQRLNALISSEAATEKAKYEANEPYKEKSGYVNKAAEAATEKGKYEAEKAKYQADKSKYETEKTKYENEKTKYENEKAAYTTNKAKVGTEKTKYETETTKYTTEKAKYETEKTKYETEKTKYKTKKEAYESKLAEYNKPSPAGKKAAQKEAYEADKTEYEAAETAYKNAEIAYKNAETAYKNAKTAYENAETAYKAEETAYKAAEVEYKAAETEYKKYEKYKEEETAYKTYEAAYKLDAQQAAEYQHYLEYKEAKAAYEKAKTEEEEAKKAGVIVETGTTC